MFVCWLVGADDCTTELNLQPVTVLIGSNQRVRKKKRIEGMMVVQEVIFFLKMKMSYRN